MKRSNRSLLHGLILVFISQAPASQASQLFYGLFGNLTGREFVMDDTQPEENYHFNAQLDAYISGETDSGLLYLAEYVSERESGHVHSHAERLHLGWRYGKWQIEAGRFHTPFNNYNTDFHHGRILYDSTERPFYLDFTHNPLAKSVLPVHTVGINIKGQHDLAKGRLTTDLLAGRGAELTAPHHHDEQGHGHDTGITGADSWDDSHKSVTLRASFRPYSVPFRHGVSLMYNEVEATEDNHSLESLPGERLADLITASLFGEWTAEAWTSRLEFMMIRGRNRTAASHSTQTSWAGYLESGFSVSETLRLYTQLSWLDPHPDSLYFRALDADNEFHDIWGVRYSINANHALKFEVNHGHYTTGKADRFIFALQWAFMLPQPFSQ